MKKLFNRKELDVEKIIRDAKIKKVSYYLLEKRELNYRFCKTEEKVQLKNCCTCTAGKRVKYLMDSLPRIQCHWLGVMDDPFADVDSEHICNFYERGYEKNLSNSKGVLQNGTGRG